MVTPRTWNRRPPLVQSMALVGQMVRCLPCKLSYMSAGDRRLNRSARNLKWNAAYSEDSSSNRSEENRAKDGTDITRRSLLLSSPALLTLSSSDLAKSEVVEVVQRSKDSSINRIEEFEKRVSSFVLSNGMRWIVAERHNAPIISCHLYADVGAADEKDGQTGIAHLLVPPTTIFINFQNLIRSPFFLFKLLRNIWHSKGLSRWGPLTGGPNLKFWINLMKAWTYKSIQKLKTKEFSSTEFHFGSTFLSSVFYDQLAALDSGNFPLAKRLSEKLVGNSPKLSFLIFNNFKWFPQILGYFQEALKEKASRFAVPNEYGAILSREGAVGLNAQTSQDSTGTKRFCSYTFIAEVILAEWLYFLMIAVYYVSLPSNKLSLWMALESARFRDPVFRELYSEKEVLYILYSGENKSTVKQSWNQNQKLQNMLEEKAFCFWDLFVRISEP